MAQEIAGPDGLLGHLTRRLLNRALEAELTSIWAMSPIRRRPWRRERAQRQAVKTILTDQGPLRIRSPRDRTAV